jgi:anti-sigma factor RsiW
MQQEMEIQIWEYIDGQCSAATRLYVEQMIATDANWKSLYEQLKTIHMALPSAIELEEPSMRFSKNVMETIVRASVVTATRQYLNPIVIRLIAGLFMISIIVLILFALSTNQPVSSQPAFDFEPAFNSKTSTILIWVNVLTGLLLLDSIIRRKKNWSAH